MSAAAETGDAAGWSLVRTAAAIAAREASATEVMEATLTRIEALQPALNAFVELRPEEAMERAAGVDRALALGGPRGPLDGVPLAFKALSDCKRGWRHSCGSRALATRVAARDSLNVERLEAAGGVFVGSTNTSELGHKAITDNRLVGPTVNPFAPGFNAGGSSGGSAAAVAAGLVVAATGSDGAGSLRVPASSCGVFTLKPTFGRVPAALRPNGFRHAWPMVQTGVLTRSVADAAALMDVLARPAAADPLCLPRPRGGFLEAVGRDDLDGLRVGYCPDWGGFPIAAEVEEVVATAVAGLARMGAEVEEVPHPHGISSDELVAAIRRALGLMLVEIIDGEVAPDRHPALEDPVRDLVTRAQGLSAIDVRADERLRTGLFESTQAQLERCDILVGPAVGVAAVPNLDDGLTLGPAAIGGREVDPLVGWSPAFLWNMTGHPAACLPAGRSGGGIPVGLQLVAGRLEDVRLLSICAAIERARPWAQSYAELRVAAAV